jgi:hypothetical protein
MRPLTAVWCLSTLPALSSATETDYVKLVDQLQAISKPGPYYGANLSIGFRGGLLVPIPIRKGEFPRQRYREDPLPYDPPLAKLIDLGIKALPTLLNHLTDARGTKLRLPLNTTATGAWYITHYDPRHRSPLGVLSGFTRWDRSLWSDHLGDERFDPAGGYRVRVGDLCYLAVGRIVNRHLYFISDARNHSSLISSPVHDRILALKARNDWIGLAPGEHASSLEFDVTHNRQPRLSLAPLRKLATYYPDDAARFASSLMKLPVCDMNTGAYNVISPSYPDRLWKDVLVEKKADWFKTAFATEVGRLSLTDDGLGYQARAKRFLKTYLPDFDVLHPPQTPAISRDDLLALIQETVGISSPELDNAVLDAFQRADATPPDYYGDPEKVDQMAFAAIRRPGLRDRVEVFRTYFEKRLKITRIVTRYTDPPEQPQKMREILKAMAGPP